MELSLDFSLKDLITIKDIESKPREELVNLVKALQIVVELQANEIEKQKQSQTKEEACMLLNKNFWIAFKRLIGYTKQIQQEHKIQIIHLKGTKNKNTGRFKIEAKIKPKKIMPWTFVLIENIPSEEIASTLYEMLEKTLEIMEPYLYEK